jgi:hypothetical protein
MFHVAASAEPQGRHTLGVELKKRLPRTASAPSVMQIDGIDNRGIAYVRQKDPPECQSVLIDTFIKVPIIGRCYIGIGNSS